jgi:hypothetical protein
LVRQIGCSAVHKDPPPTLLERPLQVVITYGMLIGFVAGALTFAVWSFFAAVTQGGPQAKQPLPTSTMQHKP